MDESETPHCCLLDLTFSSKLLSTQIADIPHKTKYETLLAPIFEYCFGTSEEEQVWADYYDEDDFNNDDSSTIENVIKVDWIRGKTFIYNQIFCLLDQNKLLFLATKLRLFERREFLLSFIRNSNEFVEPLPKVAVEMMKNERELLMAILQENGEYLCHASDELRNDFEIVKTAVQRNGKSLLYASNELKNNREIVSTAVFNDGRALEYASEELRDDKELVLLALESNTLVPGDRMLYLSERLKNDRDLVIKCHSKKMIAGNAEKFGNDREIVLIGVKLNVIEALSEFASYELRNDKEIIIQAVQVNPYAFNFATDELKNDREFVKEILKINGECFISINGPKDFQDDKEIVELALKSYPDSFHYVSDRLRQDFEFISHIIGKRGFEVLPKEFNNDREIALESIKLDSSNLKRASKELQSDRDFVLEAVKLNVFSYIPDQFCDDREIVLTAARGYNLIFLFQIIRQIEK